MSSERDGGPDGGPGGEGGNGGRGNELAGAGPAGAGPDADRHHRSRGRVRRPRYRALSPLREHLREAFWFAPLLTCVGAVLLAGLTDLLDQEIFAEASAAQTADTLLSFSSAAKSVVSTVSSAMLTFIGVVFSISLVSLQMGASQFSPRVLRLYVRSRLIKATFATCLATFVYTLLVQLGYDDTTDPSRAVSVPIVSTIVALAMVMLSLALFVLYVQATMRLLRVPHVIDRVTRESLQVLQDYRWLSPETGPTPGAAVTGPTLLHEGRGGVLRDVNIRWLLRVARRHDTVLYLVPRIGDFIAPGTPTVVVVGGTPPRPRRITTALNVGVDRTMHQDLSFGFRQLVDIAIRALSPAVNDPTTAVQAVDRIHQLLAVLAPVPLGELRHRDKDGAVRLVQPVPGWEATVDLAFTEIRICGAGQPQVTRRLVAALDDLLRITPEPRRPPLLLQRHLLTRAVAESVRDDDNRAFALAPDRQGIG
ncbi:MULTISPECIES: DUF2254 domain-containing protein [Kitasatospora]|uniref:DUF2254 domain-containing protein n=1 Tax=Kitasatospora setae (strain ATCC 33774 / DSM 43861 / JCM 3304 / KCC A-0304 / NBRC 14216 / KM-6054) TaxID=452652 RepID=E4N668_KITSK|nr:MULTISPECIES: DUF2254 domain-containing protein [Kitasatospora]BAJ26699.1 hypothetical protein KSE_08620 [Kitasatospora setae KM-6054]